MAKLIEGEDFYWENGYMVLTAKFLGKRGYCCDSGCRHCPYNSKIRKTESNLRKKQSDKGIVQANTNGE